MGNTNLLLLGGGGHCLTVIDSITMHAYAKIGIVDLPEHMGKQIYGVPVIGIDEDLSGLRKQYSYSFVSLGSVGTWRNRQRLFELAERAGYSMARILHPSAIISTSSHLERGVLAAPRVTVNALCQIEKNCILNTGSIIEHQCHIGAHAHIAPGAVLCGNVLVGEGSHIGAGTVVKQGVKIGKNVLIGIGSVVTSDIPDNVMAYGNPCRMVK